MAIETLSSGAASASGESFSFLVDYDTVAQTIGLTCTGTGHVLYVVDNAQQQPSTSILQASSGVDVALFTGQGVLNVQSVLGLSPEGGEVTVDTSAGAQSAVLLYAAITRGQITGVTLISGSGTLSHNGAVTAQQTYMGAVYADQFGTTAGPIAGAGSLDNAGRPNSGQSSSTVTYSGSRVIVLGPGAIGVDVNGGALSTSAVPSGVVGLVNPPKGTRPGLEIDCSWHPNS